LVWNSAADPPTQAHGRWHLYEIFVRIGGSQMYMRRAIDGEGEVLCPSPIQAEKSRSPQAHAKAAKETRLNG
jgi:transposase-like protein